MKTVFMGTADFAASVLKSVADAGHEVGYAISQPDKSKNRGKKILETPVKIMAKNLGIKVLQPERIKGNKEVLEILKSYDPDVIVVAAYGKLLDEDILNLPKYGCVNVHASLLPRHRGAAPIQWSIYSGDKETGVTIMQMAKGMDTGDMLSKAKIEVGKKTSQQLFEELAELGASLLTDTLVKIEEGTVAHIPQDDNEATMAPMISKKDGEIDWTKSAEEIERMTRAFYQWPGAYTNYGDKKMKIVEADVINNENDSSSINDESIPGRVISADKNGLKIETGKGCLLVTKLQMPGKKEMKVDDYLRGNKIDIFTVLG